MAIQLCPVDTANVHPRNILGSSSSFDRERLSPFGSLSAGKLWSWWAFFHGRQNRLRIVAWKFVVDIPTIDSTAAVMLLDRM